MRPVPLAVCAAVLCLAGAGIAYYGSHRQVELPVFQGKLDFFQEGRQALPVGHLPEGVKTLSAEACASCHAGEHADWKTSAHARSATEPVFAAAFKSEPRFVCRSCHAPLEEQQPLLLVKHNGRPKVLLHGLEEFIAPNRPGRGGPPPFLREKNPNYDPRLVSEGVNCVSCHVREGTILTANPKAPANVPHALSYTPKLRASEFCAGCHQFEIDNPNEHPFEQDPPANRMRLAGFGPSMIPRPAASRRGMARQPRLVSSALRLVQNSPLPDPNGNEPPVPPDPTLESQYQNEARVQHTLDELRLSPQAAKGETCQSCHMPPKNGGAGHSWPGRDSEEMLRKAVSLSARLDRKAYREGDVLQGVIRLKNEAAHRFPTGDSIHAGIVDVWLKDGERTVGREVYLLSGPGRPAQQMLQMSNLHLIRPERRDPLESPASLEAPRREDTRLLPGEEALLVYRQRVTPEIARARDLKLRVRVFHSALHPGFRHSGVDPGGVPLRLVREATLPVALH